MFAIRRAFQRRLGTSLRQPIEVVNSSTSLRMNSCRFASNLTIFDHFNSTSSLKSSAELENVKAIDPVVAANLELIDNELVNLALNESEFVTPGIDLKVIGDGNIDEIIPMLMINILKRRRKKMNKHKWKKLKRRVRNSTKYNPERRRKMKKEKRKRYLIKNGLLAPDSNFGL